MLTKDNIKRNCRIAIKNIIKEGITDVDLFSTPFEKEFLEDINFQNNIVEVVTERVLKGKFKELKMNKINHILVPKKDLCDYRKCAHVDIIDEITYLTLVLVVARKIESQRIKPSDRRIFSYRFKVNNDYLFNPHYHYTAFKKEITRKQRLKTNSVMIECDISSFYDRLNIHRIESTLLSIKGINLTAVELLNEILLFWANRDSYGLPVGSNGSRILAEAALINVDSYLIDHDVDFCRFVDDYRIFARDAETAHRHLALLTHCLSREGLFLNTSKTEMKDISHIKKKDDSKQLAEVHHDEFETEQYNTKNDKLPRIIRGYNGLIPTKFRELTYQEKLRLTKVNIENLFTDLENVAIVKAEEVKEIIKCINAQERYDLVSKVPTILSKFPQFIPYFVSFLDKSVEEVKESDFEQIVLEFSTLFDEDNVPEYILVYLVRLFSKVESGRRKLLQVYSNLKRSSGVYIGRSILSSFDNKLSRLEVINIRESFIRSDNWEKRQILRLVQQVLPDGEKRAFFKDVEMHSEDLFSKKIIKEK